jgi:hypothetical protein
MEHTAKNFVLQAGSLVALYVSLSAIVTLAFGVINTAFPDAAAGSWQYASAQNDIRLGIAMLIVFFPTYLILARAVNQRRRSSETKYLVLTKWLIYLSLLAGGAILLGDLAAVIWTYLGGEITSRFLLKAAALLIVIGAAFCYYALDAQGHWTRHEDQSKLYGVVAVTLVIAVLAFGFFYATSPSDLREERIDDQQVTDLQDMQWHVEEYYQQNGTLPATMDRAYATGLMPPTAPEGRDAYEYNITDAHNFELCATFASETRLPSRTYSPVTDALIKNPDNWDHGKGKVCFERVIGS